MSKRPRPRFYRRWVTARRLTAGVFLLALILGTFSWFPWFRGSTSGTLFLDIVPFTDPLAAIEILLASKTLHVQMLIGAGITAGFAVLAGPVFCGWVCPLGLVLDLNQSLRNFALRLMGKRHRKKHPVPTTVPPIIRYGLLGIVFGFAVLAQIPLFQILSPINLLIRGIIFVTVPGLILVAVILVVEYFQPRLWCRALCPLGALYSLLGRFGLLRVRVNSTLAGKTPCRQCSIRCPMGIRVMEEYTVNYKPSISNSACTRCGDCIDVCPKGVLRLGWWNRRLDSLAEGRIKSVCDSSDVSLPQQPAESTEPCECEV